jgi:2-amino-4-hydroxy-6-hydroxymethyldihydropteridine diphosphokinase
MRVYLSIGSNLYNREENINSALLELKCLPKSEFLSNSLFYRTKPYGVKDQPDYLNTVAELDTKLLPG